MYATMINIVLFARCTRAMASSTVEEGAGMSNDSIVNEIEPLIDEIESLRREFSDMIAELTRDKVVKAYRSKQRGLFSVLACDRTHRRNVLKKEKRKMILETRIRYSITRIRALRDTDPQKRWAHDPVCGTEGLPENREHMKQVIEMRIRYCAQRLCARKKELELMTSKEESSWIVAYWRRLVPRTVSIDDELAKYDIEDDIETLNLWCYNLSALLSETRTKQGHN